MNANVISALDHGEFRKSGYSSENGQACVEVAGSLDGVRDSKNPAGPVLRADLRSFLAAVKSGRI